MSNPMDKLMQMNELRKALVEQEDALRLAEENNDAEGIKDNEDLINILKAKIEELENNDEGVQPLENEIDLSLKKIPVKEPFFKFPRNIYYTEIEDIPECGFQFFIDKMV